MNPSTDPSSPSSPSRPSSPTPAGARRSRFTFVVAMPVLALLLVGALSLTTIGEVRVGGPQDERAQRARDLEAATSVPSQNLVAVRGLLLALEQTPETDQQAPLVDELLAIETRYNQGHAYWDLHVTDPEVRRTLLVEAHAPAAKLFGLVHEKLLPALERGERTAVSDLIHARLLPLYDLQVAASARVAQLAEVQATVVAGDTDAAVTLHTRLFTAVLAVIAIWVAAAALFLQRSARRRRPAPATPSLAGAAPTVSTEAEDHIDETAQADRVDPVTGVDSAVHSLAGLTDDRPTDDRPTDQPTDDQHTVGEQSDADSDARPRRTPSRDLEWV